MSGKELLELYFDEGKTHYAFNLMVRSYSEKLYWQIRRMVLDHDDANDVMQNTFIKAWKGLPKFNREAALSTWLFRIAHNESINFLQKNKKNKLHRSDYDLAWLQDDPYFDGDEAYLLFMQAIEQLPTKQKAVFNYKYFDELKYEEIANIVGTSVGGLKASYHHAVKKIEEYLKRH